MVRGVFHAPDMVLVIEAQFVTTRAVTKSSFTGIPGLISEARLRSRQAYSLCVSLQYLASGWLVILVSPHHSQTIFTLRLRLPVRKAAPFPAPLGKGSRSL